MRTKTYSALPKNLKPSQVWKIWSDMDLRPSWDLDTEWAKLEGPFVKGAIFYMKPKGGPKLKMRLSEVIPNQRFTDCWSVPFARLYGIHDMEETPEGLKLTTTIQIEGPLGWILRKLVGEKIVAELPEQTEACIQLARKFS
jgi:hypothetical protein